MMGLIESIFDITYLIVVVALGIRLSLLKEKQAKLFGIMAIFLGLGDAFHLLPRVLAHLSKDGFIRYQAALSWGEFITGITMTIFYVLFYFYYRSISKDFDNKKKYIVYLLAAIRIILILLPQNNWGLPDKNYTMGIVRNIPFAIMGLLLIIWTYRKRQIHGLEKMSLLISLSFIFYIPVVLWVNKIPALGALIMPKTIAYVLIVVEGFKYFIKDFKAINILDMSITYLITGLVAGVFYREFTKYYSFTEGGHLAKLHPHTLVLGFVVTIIIFILVKNLKQNDINNFKKPIHIYNTGLIATLSTMTVYGIFDVVGNGENTINISAMSGFSGLGHLLLAIGFIYTLLNIRKVSQTNNISLTNTK